MTQILLDRGWGAAGVAIASAPVKGIARLPLSILKLAFSVLGKSLSHKAASLTTQQFRRAFTNSLTESESLDAFNRYMVPAPNRVLLQTAFANFSPQSPTTVNFRNDTRAPLLLVAGGKDRIVPSSIVKSKLRPISRIESRNGLQRIFRASAFHLSSANKDCGRRSRLGACTRQWLEANRGSQSDRQLVGSTLNLRKRRPAYAR